MGARGCTLHCGRVKCSAPLDFEPLGASEARLVVDFDFESEQRPILISKDFEDETHDDVEVSRES